MARGQGGGGVGVLVLLTFRGGGGSQSMSKQKKVQGSLYSFFGGKQLLDDKEINTASETPALTKKNMQVPGGLEG